MTTSKKKSRPAGRLSKSASSKPTKAKNSPDKFTPKRVTKAIAKRLAVPYLAARGMVGQYLIKFNPEYLPPDETNQLETYTTRVASFLIPYRDINNKPIKDYWRIRYLEVVTNRKGKIVRFMSARGVGPYLYFARTWPKDFKVMTWKHIAKTLGTPIYITESEIKACALARMEVAAIGLSGVWCFLKNGKLLPEFGKIKWGGRTVYIIFDNDVTEKPNVRAALGRLVHELTNLGAILKIMNLPDFESKGGKIGIDDYLVEKKFSTNALDELEVEDCEETTMLHWLNATYYVAPEGSNVLVHNEHDEVAFRPVDFKTLFMNMFVTDANSKQKPLGTVWLQSPIRRQYKKKIFDPDAPDDPRVFNSYKGFAFEPREGDCFLYDEHIDEIICGGNTECADYLRNWMARGVQKPGLRGEIAIVLRGAQGTGKGVFANTYGALFAPHAYHASSATEITGRFSGHLKDKLFVFLDEAFYAGDKSHVGTLKRIITEPTIAIEQKYRDRLEEPNRLKIVVASNEHWVIPAGMSERRFLMLDVSSARKQQTKYFGRIIKQLENGGYEALLHDLLNRDISKFNHRQCPRTDALAEQQLYSMTTVEVYWAGILDIGRLPDPHKITSAIIVGSDAWGHVFKADLHDNFLEQARSRGLSHLPGIAQFGYQLKQLLPPGYPRNLRPRSDGKRVQVWGFPSLKICRQTFKRVQGSGQGKNA